MTYKLFTDGGARGNPGPSGIGFVLFKDEVLVDLGASYIGHSTNNIAEYTGLLEGLKLVIKNNVKEIECYMDSELVVKQINGEYKVKNENLKLIYTEIKKLTENFDVLTVKHVRREANKIADKLANIAMDAKLE